jgi:uncharacterized protein YgiM (DUF1202 family)
MADNMSEIVFPDAHTKQTRKVMPQALNVRAAPSSDAEIVEYLRTGDTVEIIVTQPGWAFVNHDTPAGGTITGWVNTRFLTGKAAAEANEPSNTESGKLLLVDERLDATKTRAQLSVDENLDVAKPGAQLNTDTAPEVDAVDAAQAFYDENPNAAVNPTDKKLIFDEQMNVVAVDVTQAYQPASAAETSLGN